jgi:hypothetical protein
MFYNICSPSLGNLDNTDGLVLSLIGVGVEIKK